MADDAPPSFEKAPSPGATGGPSALQRFATWYETRLWPTPDLSPAGRLLAVALVVGVTVCVILAQKYTLHRPLGDTDDAMRLVIVRDLVAGRGWFDQLITRVQPPTGAFLHWSRLLDGGIAGVILALKPFVGLAEAERLTRDYWPMAWIFPALIAVLAISRALGPRSAVLLTVPMLLIDDPLYRQFIPGRIDHHNLQITMTVVALSCALNAGRRARWAALGGVATGLGLAIGLEAVAFHALIGAAYALELARDRKAARPAGAYGLAWVCRRSCSPPFRRRPGAGAYPSATPFRST